MTVQMFNYFVFSKARSMLNHQTTEKLFDEIHFQPFSHQHLETIEYSFSDPIIRVLKQLTNIESIYYFEISNTVI